MQFSATVTNLRDAAQYQDKTPQMAYNGNTFNQNSANGSNKGQSHIGDLSLSQSFLTNQNQMSSSCTPNRNLYGAGTNFAGTSNKQNRQSNDIDLERDVNEESNLTNNNQLQKELFNKVHLQMQNRIEYRDDELNQNDIISPADRYEEYQDDEQQSYQDHDIGDHDLQEQQLRVVGQKSSTIQYEP